VRPSSAADAYRLDQLLQVAAEEHPDRCAVRSETAALTYAELDAAATRVASALLRSGVGIGNRVAVALEKSVEAVVAMYGILRAGAAYVPIDVSAPPARSAYIAADCCVTAIIADSSRIAALRAVDPTCAPGGIALGADTPAGCVDWEVVQRGGDELPCLSTIDTDLAYVLYTSGSTGVPKGVAISHRSSLAFVRWAHGTFALTCDDVLSSHAPFHFDLSIFDLYGAASAGACVALVPKVAALYPKLLARWIREQAVTVWYSVPSALSLLVRYGELSTQPIDSVRLMLFAGETFPVRYLRELMLCVPGAAFFNLYGPTETNVCTYHEVTRIPEPDDPPVPIGRACQNTRCQVIDETGAVLSAIGAEGELVVHGSTVADGYWGDAEKTARGFPHRGVYRTGDIVQTLSISPPSFRFVGRNDHLVKSRGYRIELHEVEAALYGHPDVEECVVVAVPDELLTSRLAAFCVVRSEISETDLKQACRERVPSYMVPDHIWMMTALPRTASDKYDRAQLAGQAQELTRH
jgi:amino acid adenylation domain-containing protein